MSAVRQAIRRVPGASRASTQAEAGQPSRAGLRLLSEVLAALAGVERPVVHIVSVSGSGQAGTGGVAREVAAAAAARFGRTLLACSSEPAAVDPCGRDLSWLMTGVLGGEPDGITPDVAVPGLYHASLAIRQAGPLDVPVQAWLAGPQVFQMIVIESPAASADPRTLAVAAQCDGSVLAVGAGATTLAELRVAARQMAGAGVRVLGTVLHDAPRIGAGAGPAGGRIGRRLRAG